MKVSEPAIAYNTSGLQILKNKLIRVIDNIDDEEKLQECLDMLNESEMPCIFTEEELDEEIRQSEASGYITQEEVLSRLAEWGFER